MVWAADSMETMMMGFLMPAVRGVRNLASSVETPQLAELAQGRRHAHQAPARPFAETLGIC